MKRSLSTLFAVALALTVVGCSDTKTAKEAAETSATPEKAKAGESAAETVSTVVGTKTVSLANGAKVIWIQDNEGEKLMPRDLFSDASDSLFASLNMPAGIPASVSTFLVQVEGVYILFDAGLGAFGGQLMSRLAALGVNTDSIGLVYLTHFHMDHIAGLVAKDSAGADTKVFKNAAIFAGRVEYDAWMNDIPKRSRRCWRLFRIQAHCCTAIFIPTTCFYSRASLC